MPEPTADAVAAALAADMVASATKAAATAAAEVLITAAKAAAVISAKDNDHDALTRMQGQMDHIAIVASGNHTALLSAVGEVKETVLKQNGRIGKLEISRVQERTIYGAILTIAPFVFYGLLRWFGT